MAITFSAPEPQHAALDALSADVLSDFVLIRTDQVDRGERLRAIDEVWAAALGQVMTRDGQKTPIEVCRLPGATRWTLVSGGHRHRGAEVEDIEYLRAEIVSAGRDDRRMREVSENLWRKGLDPIDRAAFVAEAVAIHKRRAGIDPAADGRATSAAARWQKELDIEADDATATIAGAYGFDQRVADEIGLSARTVRNDLLLYRRVAPSLIARLRDARHPALANATHLRALAKLDEYSQAKVVELLLVPGASLNYGQPTTIPEAIAHKLGPKPAAAKPAADDKRLSAFLGAFQRMGLAEKKGALAQLAGLLPTGLRLAEDRDDGAPQFSADHARYREDALESIDGAREIIDGIVEDDLLPGDRGAELSKASRSLQVTRLMIAGNGFAFGGDA